MMTFIEKFELAQQLYKDWYLALNNNGNIKKEDGNEYDWYCHTRIGELGFYGSEEEIKGDYRIFYLNNNCETNKNGTIKLPEIKYSETTDVEYLLTVNFKTIHQLIDNIIIYLRAEDSTAKIDNPIMKEINFNDPAPADIETTNFNIL